MEYTPNASFKKPGYNDPVDIADINGNFDTVDTHIGGEITSQSGTHGMRYNGTKKQFEVFNDSKNAWESVEAAKWSDFGSLEDTSWADISAASTAGIAANCWSVGDTKSVALNGTVGTLALNQTLYVYILGFDHNKDVEGTGIHFGGFKTAAINGADVCLTDAKYNSYATNGSKLFNMNHWGNYNYGGWAGSDLRYDILGSTDRAPSNYGKAVTTSRVGYDASESAATTPVANTLMAALPADLRAVMKPMTKYTNNVGDGGDTADKVTAVVDYLPLLGEYEVFGHRYYANGAEQNFQKQYDYFRAGNSRVKHKHSDTASAVYWWLRSPICGNGYAFCFVNPNGSYNSSDARYSHGLAAAFKI